MAAVLVFGTTTARSETNALPVHAGDSHEPTIGGVGPLARQAAQVGSNRGIDEGSPGSPKLRQQTASQLNGETGRGVASTGPVWLPLGPTPVPNGQTIGFSTPVSGRTTAIAVHPTNPDIVYVGTANGGLYRSLDGGGHWTAMMDQAESLAIGAISIAPSQPETIYVGTGEANFSADSYFGVGLYRIDNASGATPTLSGPFNRNAGNSDVLSGRAISRIQVHPSNPDVIFLGTTSGIAGIGGAIPLAPPNKGVYRSSNALSASPTFEYLSTTTISTNLNVPDIILDPLNPNLLIAGVIDTLGITVGGIYRSTNALSATPTFTQTFVFDGMSVSEHNTKFAIHHVSGPNPTVYAASGNHQGRVLMSTDGGASWSERVDNNFCGLSQVCFFSIAIDVDPADVTRVYLGSGSSLPFGISTNSATSFTSSSSGLHINSHVIAVSKSNPQVIYLGSDGGIYKSTNRGLNWDSLNNSSFSAFQFTGMAVHPVDPQFLLGGSYENGTNMRRADSSWVRVDSGVGGLAAIDQNATDTVNVRMYHTYFNSTSTQGYATVAQSAAAVDGGWSFRGCTGTSTGNGISCNVIGSVLYLAPLALGPGNPNTVYYGADRLYRSANTGLNHTVVSQSPIVSGVPISAIGIAANNDNVRVVGLRNGGLFGTTNGSTVLSVLDPTGAGGSVPDIHVSRVVIDPTDNNVVYVSLAGFPGAGQGIWKCSNLLAPVPAWTVAASGIPNTPVNALTLDPDDPTHVYAGTDIGVYQSTNAGVSWTSLANGLPRVPIFDIAFQAPRNPAGKGPLRIATHGRGLWELITDRLFADGFE